MAAVARWWDTSVVVEPRALSVATNRKVTSPVSSPKKDTSSEVRDEEKKGEERKRVERRLVGLEGDTHTNKHSRECYKTFQRRRPGRGGGEERSGGGPRSLGAARELGQLGLQQGGD